MTDTRGLLSAIHAADRTALDRVREAIPQIERAVDALVARLDAGGRWFNVGAGTSGRLGALDAAELPPTFGTDPSLVRAVLAGGDEAMTRAIEGAEDDASAGAGALDAAGLSANDAVVGLSASGTTPFVLGAMRRARERGALGIALACAKKTPLAALGEIAIEVDTGPEVVSGSTRMKAGAAQMLVLRMLSTAVMARRGLVIRGEMVAMRPTNEKLRARAVRIVRTLLSVSEERARALLDVAGWDLPVALVAGTHGVSPDAARARLLDCKGNVAKAIAE